MWALLRTATSVEDTSAVLDSLAARLASAQPAVQPPDSRALQAVLAALRNEATSAAAARVLQILCQQHASLLIRGGTMAPLCEAAASANGTVQTCAVSCLAALARSSAAKSLSLPETCLPTLLAALRPSSSLACRAAAANAAVALTEGDTGATAQAVRFGVVPSLADLLESAATADRPSAAEAEALAGATLGLVRAVAQLSVGRARLRSCDNAAVLDHVVALLLTPSLSASAAHTCRALCQSGGAPFARRLLLAPSLPAALPLLLTSADAPVRAVLLALTAPLLAAPTAADAIMAPEGDAGSAQGSALGGAGAGSEAAAAASWRALRTTARDVLSRAEASRCPEHRAACVALRATLAVAEAHGAGGAAQQHRSALGAALGAYTGAPAPTKAAAGVAGAAPTASAEALSAPVTAPFDLVSGAPVVSEASVVIGRAGGARVPLGSLSALEGARPRRLQGRLEVNQSPNLALEDPRGAVASALKRGAKGGADARGGGESGGGGGESGGGSEGHGLVLDSSLHEALRLADAQLAQLDRALNTARGALQAQQSAAKAAERRHGLETSLLASALRHAEGMVATAAAEAARAQEDAQARREAAESERTRAEAALAAAARADRQAAQANAARAEAELAQKEAHRARQAAMQTVHEQCEIARTAAYAEATDRHYRQSEAAKQAAVSLAVRRAVAKAVGAAEQAAREQLMRAHEVANAEAAAQAQAAVEAAVEEATARARASHEAALSAALAAEREDHRCAFTAEREDHARQMHVLRAAHASAQEAAEAARRAAAATASAAARDVASARADAAEARREAAAAKERMVEAARTSEEATRAATAAAGTREAEACAYLKESRDQVRLMTF